MPAGKQKFELLVAVVVARNRGDHPWRRTMRHGVISVERAPGVARDASSRPLTPDEREARNAEIVEALETSSASAVAELFGTTRNAVLGHSYRYRQAHGLPAATNSATQAARRAAVVSALETSSAETVAARFGLAVRTVRDSAYTVRVAARAKGTTLPRAAPTAPPPVFPPVPVIVCAPVERVSLIDAMPGQCRSLDADGLCCSRPVVNCRSWCRDHLLEYTQPSRRRTS